MDKDIGEIRPLEEREGVQLIIDNNFVHIPLTRYDELIKAEAELDVLLRAYHQSESYQLADIVAAVFGPKAKDGEEGAE